MIMVYKCFVSIIYPLQYKDNDNQIYDNDELLNLSWCDVKCVCFLFIRRIGKEHWELNLGVIGMPLISNHTLILCFVFANMFKLIAGDPWLYQSYPSFINQGKQNQPCPYAVSTWTWQMQHVEGTGHTRVIEPSSVVAKNLGFTWIHMDTLSVHDVFPTNLDKTESIGPRCWISMKAGLPSCEN